MAFSYFSKRPSIRVTDGTSEVILFPRNESNDCSRVKKFAEVRVDLNPRVKTSGWRDGVPAGILQPAAYLYYLAGDQDISKEYFRKSIEKADGEFFRTDAVPLRGLLWTRKAISWSFLKNYDESATAAIEAERQAGGTPITQVLINYPEGENLGKAIVELRKYVNRQYNVEADVFQDITILELAETFLSEQQAE